MNWLIQMRTQQSATVTRIRTHDHLIWYDDLAVKTSAQPNGQSSQPLINCKYATHALWKVAFAKMFMYKVMLLGKFCDNCVFCPLSQMFAESFQVNCVITVYLFNYLKCLQKLNIT